MQRKPVDIRAVKDSLKRLGALALTHPELVNKHGASQDAWLDVLKQDEDMGKTTAERQREYRERQAELGNVQTVLWLPADTVQALDALKGKHGGSRESVVVAAVKALKKDDVVLDALGEHIATHFIAAKEGAWREFIAQVHPWELERYLGRF